MVLAPGQLGDRRLGAGLLALGDPREGAQPAEAHHLHAGVGPGELLADQRIGVLAVLPGGLDQVPELPLEAQVLHGGRAAALVPERGHGHLPAVVEAADHIEQRYPHAVDEVLAELGRAGHLPDRPVLHAGVLEREQHVRQPSVLGRIGVAAAEREHHGRPRGA